MVSIKATIWIKQGLHALSYNIENYKINSMQMWLKYIFGTYHNIFHRY